MEDFSEKRGIKSEKRPSQELKQGYTRVKKKGCSSDVEGIEQCKTDEKVFRRGLVGLQQDYSNIRNSVETT